MRLPAEPDRREYRDIRRVLTLTEALKSLPRAVNEPWTEALSCFRDFTIAHPRLSEVKETLLAAIQQSAPNTLVMVFGPTGVGKTTLRTRIEQILVQAMAGDLATDRTTIPVVSVSAVAPIYGSFNWRDHFKRVLSQIEEPLVNYKRLPLGDGTHGTGLPGQVFKSDVGAEYRYAVEQALRFRRPVAVLIDEAQHFAKVKSGRKLLDQLDVIKSIADCTRTIHVLFGTYELLAFRNLNGQLSRRSIDVHFRRYRAEDTEDRKIFANVLRSFEQRLPFPEPPDLVKDWEYIYERTLGCVGVLKDWLMRALPAVLREGRRTLRRRDLEPFALSVSQCDRMLSEMLEGESRLEETKDSRLRLRLRLGLGDDSESLKLVEHKSSDAIPEGQGVYRSRRRPGQRRPGRDRIGTAQVALGGRSHV
jgi:energy-coupling factor transporter ATP-binding protein EcfA2